MGQKLQPASRGRRDRRENNASGHNFRCSKLSFESLEQRQLLSVNPIISEFMASNSATMVDYYGKYSDWLEIYNPDATPLNFAGWKLKDNNTVWTIPANVTIPALSYLKIFCDNRDTIAPNGELHTNFKLGAGGDYLGLLKPDNTVVSEYAPEYPQQFADVSYGLVLEGQSTPIISSGTAAKALVPTASNGGSELGTSWQGGPANEPFDDGSWQSGTTGVGMSSTMTPIASANLKLRLNADTSSGIVNDTSGAGHNGSNSGASWVASNTDGASEPLTRGGSMQFNASENDRVAVAGNTDFYNATQGAIMFWMRSSGTYGASGDGAVLVDYRTTTGMLISQTNAGQIRVRSFNTAVVNDVLSNAAVSDNLWHHVAVTFDQSTNGACAIYIDGVLDNQGVNGANWTWGSSSSVLEIGRCTISHIPALTMKNYNGLMDDVRFYNAPLASADIANIAKGADENVNSADVGLNLAAQPMLNVNSSAFIRIPFTIADTNSVHDLLLSVRYNDGFIAWINGQQVAASNAPDSPAWNSTATDIHSLGKTWRGLIDDLSDVLQTGINILAIQGLNYSASDPSFLIVPQLSANVTSIYGTAGKYFIAPTPGNVNGSGTADLGPLVKNVSIPAAQPAAGTSIVVTAQVTPTINPIQTSSVTLHYRTMYTTEKTVSMYDDGTHDDSHAGDGIYTGTIPANTATAGQMLRWYVTANDTVAHPGRWPLVVPLIGNDGGPEYEGTVIANPSLSSTLPIFQSFMSSTGSADTRTGTRASVFYLGRFYDNVFVSLRGGYTTSGNKFKFNSGYDFTFAEDQDPVKTINLNQQGYDESYARPEVAFETMSEAGVAASIAFPLRVQRNNAFYKVMNFIEQVNNRFLEREGLYKNSAIYKGNTDVMSSASYFTKNNRDEVPGTADLQAFLNGLHLTDLAARKRFIYDNVNIPAMLDYLSAITLVMDNDHVQKNYFLICDTNDGANSTYGYANANGTNEWTMVPWDKDLTFGKCFGLSDYYINDPYAHPFFGDSNHPKYDGPVNWMIDSLLDIPEIKQMYVRRLRTLMDELLQPPGTADGNCYFENRFDELYAKLAGDPSLSSQASTLRYYIDDIKERYLDPRRTHLYVDHLVGSGYPDCAGIPAAQADNPIVNFGSYEISPASGNQDQEYLTLVNPNNFAIDISGWKLTGGIELTFKEGVVIPASGTLYTGTLYVSPNVYAFRQRTTGPSGNQGLLVQGNYDGYLSKWGESVRLLNLEDTVVATLTTVSDPSLVQQYLRVTEVMYHPADPPSGSPYTNEDFQFIELKNISSTETLSLNGVRFTDGIAFGFTGGSVTSLAPEAHVLIVSNLAAFRSRYGTGFDSIIAGVFAKVNSTDLNPTRLAKSGEKLTLVDSVGETILSFSYQDSRYKQTDGKGNSLVIRDMLSADRDSWGQREGWFASHDSDGNGSPGADETATYAADAIVVNEILAHRTDEPGALGDWVEFHNTTEAAIDIGGWYLSNKNEDDDLQQYQIPAGTVIPAHGYKAFNWRDNFGSTSHPGCITPFTFGEMGGTVYLTSAVGGALTDYQVSEKFGSSDTGITLGRYLKSTGGKDFVAMSSPTYEAANSAPLVGPVVINEIYYHPAVGKDAYIELKNITDSAVNLYDPARPQNTWHLAEGVELKFPSGATIAANGYALIVNIAPAYYRAKYGIPDSVPIFGPYLFELDKSGDTIELKYPDDPQPDGDVPYDRMDQVTYEDGGLWPKSADGDKASLNRISSTAYGNDVANWTAGWPTPGADNLAFVANPITLVTPATATAQSGSSMIYLSALATTAVGDPSSLTYSWAVTSKPADAYDPYLYYSSYYGYEAYLYDPGAYTFTVAISNMFGASIISSVSITVVPEISRLYLLPDSSLLAPGSQQQFTAFYADQFGNRYSSQPADVDWYASSGTFSADGLFTAPSTTGSITIYAYSGSFYGYADVQIGNPQGYWKFDEASGTTAADSSGNGFNGTLSSTGCTWTTAGLFGNALSFNGSSGRVAVPFNASETAFGISFWFKTSSQNVGLFEVANSSGSSRDRCLYLSGGYLNAYLYNGETITAYENLADGKWHNVVYTFGNEYPTSQILLVDGEWWGYGSKSQSDFNWDTQIFIGYTDLASQPYFNGIIDDVRIYNFGVPYDAAAFLASVPPTNITLSATSAGAENRPGVTIGTLTTTDVNTRDTYLYAIKNDPTGKFEITDSVLKLKEGQSLDFEATPTVPLTIRTYNSAGQYYEKIFTVTVTDVAETMTVTAADWAAAGTSAVTMKLAADNKLHFYITGTTTDIVPPHLLTKVNGIDVAGRDLTDVLTLDSMGTAAKNLAIRNTTAVIGRDNAISAGSSVTIDGGSLDFNGHADAIGNLLITNNGQMIAAAIKNNSTTVASGTLTVGSLICSTLIIGSASAASASAPASSSSPAIQAAAGASEANSAIADTASSPAKLDAAIVQEASLPDESPAAYSAEAENFVSVPTAESFLGSNIAVVASSPIVPIAVPSASRSVPSSAAEKLKTFAGGSSWLPTLDMLQTNSIDASLANLLFEKRLHLDHACLLAAQQEKPAIADSVGNRLPTSASTGQQTRLTALQSIVRETSPDASSDSGYIDRNHSRKRTALIKGTVDLVLALDDVLAED